MRTLVVGCNHRSAAVEVREKLAFDAEALGRAQSLFTESWPQAEAVLLSTCNRMELYVARPEQAGPTIAEAIAFIGRCHGLAPESYASALYGHEGLEAVRHLFRVVSSLDSMVVGETQILGQVREAYEAAKSAGSARRHLGELFPRAFSVAKNVQATTGITQGRLSVGSAAVDLAGQIFSRFDDKQVLMVGAGKMGELTLTHLLAAKPRRLWVTNRTRAAADELAERLRVRHGVDAGVIPFEHWVPRLAEMDIVISCTGAREPILTARAFAGVPAARGYRPLLLVDIAVPRDVEPEVGEAEGVFLYNIDDLQRVTQAGLAHRREAVGRSQQIVEAGVLEYAQRQDRARLAPIVAALREHFATVAREQFEWVAPKLHDASPRDRELIEQMLHRTVQKLLHRPVHLMNSQVDNGAARVYADTLRALFELPDLPESSSSPTSGSAQPPEPQSDAEHGSSTERSA